MVELPEEQIASEIMRSLRGRRSQVGFSRRLGYKSNAAYTWESGKRFMTAGSFFQATARVGSPLGQAFERFFGHGHPWATQGLTGIDAVVPFLQAIRGNTPVVEIARRAGVHRSSARRWFVGETQPRLPDLLRIVAAASNRLLDFVAVFVPPATVPCLAERWRELTAARELLTSSPWTSPVLLVLELAAYKDLKAHSAAWIANRLQIPEVTVAQSIQLLAAAGQIRRRKAHYERTFISLIDIKHSQNTGLPLREFWAEHARTQFAKQPDALLAWNIGTVSNDDYQRIVAIQRRAFQEVRALVAASNEAERVVLMSWALGLLDDAEGEGAAG